MEAKHTPPSEATVEADKRLSREADYFYDRDEWEVTYHDVYELAESCDLECDRTGKIVSVGRLKSLPTVYAVNLPVTWDDEGEPEEWEVFLFETIEEARAATSALSTMGKRS